MELTRLNSERRVAYLHFDEAYDMLKELNCKYQAHLIVVLRLLVQSRLCVSSSGLDPDVLFEFLLQDVYGEINIRVLNLIKSSIDSEIRTYFPELKFHSLPVNNIRHMWGTAIAVRVEKWQ